MRENTGAGMRLMSHTHTTENVMRLQMMKSKRMGVVIGGMKRRKLYAGCTFQRNAHGSGRFSVDIHCDATDENRQRFPDAQNMDGFLWVGSLDWTE